MNFFKSVFADDPDPPNPESEQPGGSNPNPDQQSPDPKSSQPNPHPTGGWMFGDLIKTLATKSESVIETYRRDLQEFGSGLKKEIEVAQGSLETVGHVIDEFGNTVLKGTAQMISQGTDGILVAGHESDSSDANNNQSFTGFDSRRYSRFDAQVRALQGDVSTYCDDVEDLEDYEKWKLGFVLDEKREEIEGLLGGNGGMEVIYRRVVPNSVDHETFWCRYFYRVYKLRQAEDVRVNLVKRAISVEDDEELSWDVDDDEFDENVSNAVVAKANSGKNNEVVGEDNGKEVGRVEDFKVGEVGGVGEEANVVSKKGEVGEDNGKEVGKVEDVKVGEVGGVGEEANVVSKKGDLAESREDLVRKDEEEKTNVKEESSFVEESQVIGSLSVVDEKDGKSPKLDSDVKLSGDKETEEKLPVEGDSGKKDLPSKSEAPKNNAASGVSVRSPPPEEEDLGWDEIEDLSSIDDKKVSRGGGSGTPTPNKEELRKRLSTAEDEEEDLSWDIEDDDDVPAKA